MKIENFFSPELEKEKLKIIFFGSSKLVLPIIQTLEKNFDLKLVITTEQNPTDAIPKHCREHDIPYQSVTTLKDPSLQSLTINQNCPLAVLADFGLIIPDEILNAFPKGIINVHPSLLPKFRGPTPVQSAMLSGDTQTGVSIIRLDNEVDHGPLLTQITEPIMTSDTGETLHVRLFEIGAKVLAEVLPKYLSGALETTPQDHTKASFTTRLTRDSGFFEETNPPKPEKLKQMINAFYPWPGVWTKTMLKGEVKRIKFLPQNKIHVQDKKPMPHKDFLNGYPEKKEWLLNMLGR